MNISDLYPELVQAGGLQATVNIELKKIGSKLIVTACDRRGFTSYARIESKNRYSQIYIAAEERLYIFDYWTDGRILANGSTQNLSLLLYSIDTWLMHDDISIFELAKSFDFIISNEKAALQGNINKVEYAWNSLLNAKYHTNPKLYSFIQLSMQDIVVGKLFPYISLDRLCFSRCTGYPYTSDTPYIYVDKDNNFVVVSPPGTEIDKGDAKKALSILKENLPNNIAPAIKGTANDKIS